GRTHQQGEANLAACGGVEPGGSRAEIIQILGAPTTIKANQAMTRVALTFTSPVLAEKPIRAVVNVREDVVMEIDCGDGRITTYEEYLNHTAAHGYPLVPGDNDTDVLYVVVLVL